MPFLSGRQVAVTTYAELADFGEGRASARSRQAVRRCLSEPLGEYSEPGITAEPALHPSEPCAFAVEFKKL